MFEPFELQVILDVWFVLFVCLCPMSLKNCCVVCCIHCVQEKSVKKEDTIEVKMPTEKQDERASVGI